MYSTGIMYKTPMTTCVIVYIFWASFYEVKSGGLFFLCWMKNYGFI
jgi:hypothetical protein